MGLSGLFIVLFGWVLVAFFTTSYQNKRRWEAKKKDLIEHCIPVCTESTPGICTKTCTISEIHKYAIEKISQ